MRLFLAVVVLVPVAACAEPDGSFGEPNGIIGRELPGEDGDVGGSSGASTSGDFGGAYSATANKPATTLEAAHQAKGGPAPAAVGDCLPCHKTGGQAAAKPFSFGGRIAKNAADVDVVVLGAERIGPVKSDKDGFFWQSSGGVKKDSRVKVRNARTESAMNSTLAADTGGGCDAAGCHGGSQGRAGGRL